MELKAFSKVLTVVACALMLCVLSPTFGAADQAQYIYDDLGRLSQVIDGQGNVATYNFDAEYRQRGRIGQCFDRRDESNRRGAGH